MLCEQDAAKALEDHRSNRDMDVMRFCKITIQTAEWRFCNNQNPCDTAKIVFCKVAIGGSIATLQKTIFAVSQGF
jgi:hypothetical protein